MAEGGAEDVVLDDQNGSFQRKLQLASEDPGELAWKLCLHGQNLKKGNLHKEIAQLELLNSCLILLTPMQRSLLCICNIPGVERWCLINNFADASFIVSLPLYLLFSASWCSVL